MRKRMGWMVSAMLLMLGCPWLAVTFAGSAGMAVCFVLFFAVNPVFCAACGIAAGRNVKQLWFLPVLTAGAFLAGVWLFFEMGEPAFLWYAACYLLIGLGAMLLSAMVKKWGK